MAIQYDATAVPTWLSSGSARRLALETWRLTEEALGARWQGLLVTDQAVVPWATGQGLLRSSAAGVIANRAFTAASLYTNGVVSGALDLARWPVMMRASMRSLTVTSAAVQFGGINLFDYPPALQRLAALQANAERRIESLASRIMRPKEEDGITLAQARAWSGASLRGIVRAAGMIGDTAHYEDQPVQRIMQAFEDHCQSCPGKVGLYANLEECLAACGGFPADGSDDCHGNCHCRLEPATNYSVFGAETAGLLSPEGPGSVTPLRLIDAPPRTVQPPLVPASAAIDLVAYVTRLALTLDAAGD